MLLTMAVVFVYRLIWSYQFLRFKTKKNRLTDETPSYSHLLRVSPIEIEVDSAALSLLAHAQSSHQTSSYIKLLSVIRVWFDRF